MNDASRPANQAAPRLSRNPADYERVFHDPAVADTVFQQGQERGAVAEFFDDANNIGFLFDDCCFLARCVEPHVYELSSAALPSVAGSYVIEAAHTAIRIMFFATPALELLSRVVDGNDGASALVERTGFAHEFRRNDVWEGPDGSRDVDYFALRYPDWIKRQDWLRASGEWFHSLAGAPADDRDPLRDMYIGAAVETLLSGQSDKAVALYNRWARFAGYEPTEIISREPLTINLGHRCLTVTDGNIEVATCQ